jgi:transposase, IS30 family
MKKYHHLNSEKRDYLAILLALGISQKDISGFLECSAATISREIKRNNTNGVYLGFSAHSKAEKRQRCTQRKPRKIVKDSAVEKYILDKLRIRWSPKQISIKLMEEMSVQISHETIYQYIYVQCKSELKKELIAHLRQRKPIRKSRKGVTESRGTIPDMISIHQRPQEVESRNIPGHWEGDLIVGKDHKSAIGTLVERNTRYLIIVPLVHKDAESVRKEFAKAFHKLPEKLRQSLTYDRGKEMTEHAKFTAATKMKVYFCDPHSPWQRGTNENTNGLVRDFFPKGTDFSKITKKELKFVEKALNERPRATLGYRNPAEKFNELILNHQKIAFAS